MNTTINIGASTREKLKKFGSKGETYDEILLHLMEVAKLHNFLEEQKWILKHEKFYSAEDL